MQKIPTIFFGASSYVIPLIQLLNEKYSLKLVITTEQKPTDAVPNYCITNNIPYISVTSALDLQNTKYKILDTKSPVAILADFRLMIKEDVLNLFPKGIINIHPSLLPEYRGPTPGVAALLDGKQETGVSLMVLDTQLDHGPLLGQVVEHILPTDTSVSLYTRLFAKGAQLLEKNLPLYIDGSLKPLAQDDSKATYTDFLTRDSGYIDLAHNSELITHNLDNKIRAYFPWPGVWTTVRIKNKESRIKLLPENKIQLDGKKPISYHDFINGYDEGKEILEKLHLIP